ncbi:MAG: hypothetical protein Q9170_002916 [Blastenia crenularia]
MAEDIKEDWRKAIQTFTAFWEEYRLCSEETKKILWVFYDGFKSSESTYKVRDFELSRRSHGHISRLKQRSEATVMPFDSSSDRYSVSNKGSHLRHKSRPDTEPWGSLVGSREQLYVGSQETLVQSTHSSYENSQGILAQPTYNTPKPANQFQQSESHDDTREQKRQHKEEEKAWARKVKYLERKAREWDRARKQREHDAKMRKEGHRGYEE